MVFMAPEQIIFLLAATVTLVAAIFVVSNRNLIHSALWLVLALFGVAVLYVLLQAGFFAVVQVVVYIGAISILFIFTAMLTRRVMQDTGPQNNANWLLGALIALLFFVGLTVVLLRVPGMTILAPEMAEGADPLRQLGIQMVSADGYLLPFEMASVLLVAAMIGAIYVAWERKK
jgi:NADH:ubiquinone oxidoreductase subunit 6 (subunit J)